jgi:hypothetical protein
LRPGLLQLHVIAHNTDNVRLGSHRFFEVAGGGHEFFKPFCLKNRRRGMPEVWCNVNDMKRISRSPSAPTAQNSFRPATFQEKTVLELPQCAYIH